MGMLVRIAWRNIWRQRRRTWITAGAMASGVAFCMGVIALVDGLYLDLFDILVTDSIGHAQIHDAEFPKKRGLHAYITAGEEVTRELEALPQVAHAAPRVYGFALLGTDDKSVGAQLIGIDPAREAALTHLDGSVSAGSYALGNGQILLGVELARRLGVGVGGEVVAVTQAADGSLGNALYGVSGLVKTGAVARDRGGAFLHIDDARELLALTNQIHEIALDARGRRDIPTLVEAARPLAEAHGLLLRSWGQINPQLAQMLDFADASSVIFLIIIFAVAAIGILNTMLMSVFERTRELGVIRALGLKGRQMVALVLWETLALVLVALAIGVPVGFGLDLYIIRHGIDLSGVMQGYSVVGTKFGGVLRGAFRVAPVVQTVVGLFVVSLLAALWPAVRAARLEPVTAMQQE